MKVVSWTFPRFYLPYYFLHLGSNCVRLQSCRFVSADQNNGNLVAHYFPFGKEIYLQWLPCVPVP